jgi:hypothetical protein
MPSKAYQLADDIRGAVASLPSHLNPLCQAIAAKGGPKPPSGLPHSLLPLKPHMLMMIACAQLLLLYSAHTCLPKRDLCFQARMSDESQLAPHPKKRKNTSAVQSLLGMKPL